MGKLKEYVEFVRGVSYKKNDSRKEIENDYMPILRANNINNNKIIFNDLVFIPKSFVKTEQIIRKNDIIITMSSGSKNHVGKTAIALKDYEAGFGAFCGKLIPHSINPLYLSFLLQSSGFRKHIETVCKGTNINNLKQSHILDYEIFLPSLDEQNRIVTRIEELFSELDKAVETLNKTKEQLAVYRQAVLKEAFDDAISDQKENVLFLPIEKLLTSERKGMATGPFGTMIKKHEHQSSGIPMLGIENIGRGKFLDGNKIFVTPEKAKELQAFVLHENDIIISRSGTVGEICSIPARAEGALLSTNLMRVSLNSSMILSDYFIYLFQSKGVVLDQVKELCKGSTRMFLNQTILKQIIFPVPKIEKQKSIITLIESRLSVCNSIEKTVNSALQQAEAMRQSILKKAFEGGL